MGNEIRAINEPKLRIETNSNDRWQHPLEQSRYVKYVSTYVIVHCELMNGTGNQYLRRCSRMPSTTNNTSTCEIKQQN